MSTKEWMPHASCKRIPSWFELPDKEQVRVCDDCAVRPECLEYGLTQSLSRARSSVVYGGLTGHQLVQMARARARIEAEK